MARKILLADDSVTAQNMGRKILADAGYEVTTVNNGSAALKKIAESRPDLIVLDVYMPGYSGLEVCQRLKENAETARIPILLTVGKLEPFKPEEARRVRAEGYIVKPFEASELLSALTKLEDKMVPHADSSKPGRFARAIAAVEEGRYDKTVAIDEDSGWKNRISFPSKKKKKPEPEDSDDPAIYNPVNKDLRTVVEHKSAPADPKPVESRVDVGALASEGLPKDVTPEEIAALAAAAAQVTKSINGHNVEPAPSQQVSSSELKSAEDSAEKSESKVEAKGEAGVKVEASSSTAPAPESVSPKEDAPPQSSPEQPVPVAEISAPVEATFAAGKVEDEHPSVITALPAAAVESTHSNVESASQELSKAAEAEPVTMAVGPQQGSSSRWTAVAVALSPEETGISIDDEMRRAQGAFVGASISSSHPEPAAIAPAAEVPEALATSSVMVTAPVAEPASSSFAEVAQALSSAASAAHESVSAMVKEFENVGARSTVSAEPSESRQPVEEAAPPAVESSATPTESHAQEPASQASAPMELPPQPELAATVAPASNQPQIEPTSAPAEIQSQESREPEKSPEPPVVASSTSTEAPASPTPAEVVVAPEPVVQETSQAAEAVAQVAEPIQPDASGISQPENESSANAADLSWRRLREDSKPGTETAASRDEAAMAVAAGAEKAPEAAQAESDEAPEIASIVDSVLADLRPKIVAEISKKLGKKK